MRPRSRAGGHGVGGEREDPARAVSPARGASDKARTGAIERPNPRARRLAARARRPVQSGRSHGRPPPETARQGLAVGLLALLLAGVVRLASGAQLEPADLVFNNGTEVQTLDPASVTGVPEGRVVRALFEGLVVKHPRTLEPLPGMAERWELSEDGRTWTFWIREGAEWTNGDPVTAEDFVYSFRRFLHPSTAAYYAYQLWYVRGARAYTRLPDELQFARELPGTRPSAAGYPARSPGMYALERRNTRCRNSRAAPL